MYLITKGLRRIVDDDRLGEIPPQNVEVLDVVAVDAHAVLSEQPVPANIINPSHAIKN